MRWRRKLSDAATDDETAIEQQAAHVQHHACQQLEQAKNHAIIRLLSR